METMQEIISAIEREDRKALVLLACNVLNEIAKTEKALRRKKLRHVDPTSKTAMEKQELEMFGKDTEALELQEKLDDLKAQLRAISIAIQVLQPISADMLILSDKQLRE